MKTILYTNRGKHRENNEDGVLVDQTMIVESLDHSLKTVCQSKACVTDGMGGSARGEYATKQFLENLQRENCNTFSDLESIVYHTQEEIKGIDTGCAIAGICISETSFVYNIGDCRVYKREGAFLNQLTHDHSVVQQLIDDGVISPEEALTHPKKHVLTSAITSKDKVDIYMKKIVLKQGDVYLVCSDGLWGEFEIDELEECFHHEELEQIDHSITDKLMTKPLQDNVSYILMEIT